MDYISKPELNVVVDSVTEALQTINRRPHLFRFENDRSVYLIMRQTVSGRSLTLEIFYEIVNDSDISTYFDKINRFKVFCRH